MFSPIAQGVEARLANQAATIETSKPATLARFPQFLRNKSTIWGVGGPLSALASLHPHSRGGNNQCGDGPAPPTNLVRGSHLSQRRERWGTLFIFCGFRKQSQGQRAGAPALHGGCRSDPVHAETKIPRVARDDNLIGRQFVFVYANSRLSGSWSRRQASR